MVPVVLAKIYRMLNRLSPDERGVVMRMLLTTYPVETTATPGALRMRQLRERRRASQEPNSAAQVTHGDVTSDAQVTHASVTSDAQVTHDVTHAVVSLFPAVPVVSGEVPVVQEPATTGNTKTSEELQKAPRVEREGAAIAKRSEKAVAIVSAKPRAEVKQAIDHFHTIFLERNGEKPHITGKDANLAKQLVTRHGLAKVKEVMEAMLDSLDPYIAQAGPSFGLLSSQWNKLVQLPRRQIHERTRNNLMAVKEALAIAEEGRRERS